MNSETPPAKEDSGDPVDNSNVLDMEPSEFENDLVSSSVTEVLQIDMLLDMIVSRSLTTTSESMTDQNSSEVQLTGVRFLRLVNRSWLQSVSRVMTKKGKPLFTFDLSKDKEADSQKWEFKRKYYDETRQQTYCFLNTDDDASPPLSIHRPIPPFKLKIYINDSTGEEGFRLIQNCFLNFGSGLVNLEFYVGNGALPINLDLPETLSLRNLRTLQIRQNPQSTSPTRTEQLFLLVHSILTAAESLKSFEIEANFKIEVSPNCSISFNLPFIPASLRQLSADLGEIGSAELEEFLGSRPIPILTQLELIHGEIENLEDGTLVRILDNLKTSLKIFTIERYDKDYFEASVLRSGTILRFPVMEKLEKLKICTELVELEPGQAPLQRFIPIVSHLELTRQTKEILQGWMEGSEYPAVETLAIQCIADGEDLDDPDDICLGLDIEVAGWINMSFPNVTKLTVSVVVPVETSGLKTIFEEMTQLTSLHIEVRGSYYNDTNERFEFMDMALTELPSEIVCAFTEDPELCDGIEIKRGICKLKNLESLYLEHWPVDHQSRYQLSLDLTLTCALGNLPKLKTVRLGSHHHPGSSWNVSAAARSKLNERVEILEGLE